MNILAILLVFGVLTLLYGFVLAHFGMKRLEITRKFSRPAVFEGERGEMIETVSNYSSLPVPWLRVESRIPGGLQLGKMENLDLNGGMYYQSIFTVLPRQRIVRRHFVRFAHRGVYNVGNAALTCGGVSGLNSHSRDQDLNASVVVWPRLLDEDALSQLLDGATENAGGAHHRRMAAAPSPVGGPVHHLRHPRLPGRRPGARYPLARHRPHRRGAGARA